MMWRFAAAGAHVPSRNCLRLGRALAIGPVLGCSALVANHLAPTRCEDAAAIVAKARADALPARPSLLLRCVYEAVGTALLVGSGCGVVCAAKYAHSGAGPIGIACVWGISVALAVYATRDTSGAHLNPAVTCALAATERMELGDAPPYMLAQLLGATVAAAINYCVFANGITALEAGKIVRGSKALLVFLIFTISDEANSVPPAAAPVLVGAAVTTLVATFGPITGAGSAAWSSWWVYTIGPLAGAVLGAKAYQALAAQRKRDATA